MRSDASLLCIENIRTGLKFPMHYITMDDAEGVEESKHISSTSILVMCFCFLDKGWGKTSNLYPCMQCVTYLKHKQKLPGVVRQMIRLIWRDFDDSIEVLFFKSGCVTRGQR